MRGSREYPQAWPLPSPCMATHTTALLHRLLGWKSESRAWKYARFLISSPGSIWFPQLSCRNLGLRPSHHESVQDGAGVGGQQRARNQLCGVYTSSRDGPSGPRNTFCAPPCASLPLLNATGQPWVTLSPRHEHLSAVRKPRQGTRAWNSSNTVYSRCGRRVIRSPRVVHAGKSSNTK